MGRLFWKLFVAFWLALLVAGLGVGVAVWLHRGPPPADVPMLASGPRAARLVASTAVILRHGGAEALRDALDDWNRSPGGAHVFAVDESGQELIGRTVSPETLAQARRTAESAKEGLRLARLERSNGRSYLLFVPAASGPPEHEGPPSPVAPIVAGLLASLGFSALLAWYLTRPIRHLRAAFDAASAGRLDTRVGPRMGRRRDEVADLGRDFDRMAEQLGDLVESHRRLLHDVSHELRSPLARLQAAIGLARQRPERIDDSLDRIEREAGRLDGLVGELLTLSRLDAGMGGGADERIDLTELAREVAADAGFEAEASGRQVRFVGAGEIPVDARPELLYRALENLVRNAVKFAPEGTVVEMEVGRRANPEQALVTVADRGPGVPEKDLEAIFEPFFRSESGTGKAGFGLGLAIARRAVRAHGGSLRAFNRAGGGLKVEMALPLGPSGRLAGPAL